jgi:DNA-binding NarL/FixJ family response regulator
MKLDLSNTVRLLIADDHSVIAKGMTLLVANHFNIKYIVECTKPEFIKDQVLKNRITHLVLDVSFPEDSGTNYLRELYNSTPMLRIMLFTMHPPNLFTQLSSEFPQLQYCQKSASEETLLNKLNVLFGISQDKKDFATKYQYSKQYKLSKGEEQVMQWLLQGKSTQEIASLMGIKNNTVSTYKRRIFDKTDTQNIIQLSQIFKK